jgi:hypothetical protein
VGIVSGVGDEAVVPIALREPEEDDAALPLCEPHELTTSTAIAASTGRTGRRRRRVGVSAAPAHLDSAILAANQ